MCSWAEEEIDVETSDGHAVSQVGLFGGRVAARASVTHSPSESSDSSSSTSSPSRSAAAPPAMLLQPGRLAPVWRVDAAEAQTRALYAFDELPLGRGAYGEVLSATHRRTGARRAVKVVTKALLKPYVGDACAFARREAAILRRLDHPNIVRMHEAFEDDDKIFLVLELCEGGDLLERVAGAKDRMPERCAAVLMTQMLSALQHLSLHGVLHRDLKPENFLFLGREPEIEPLPPATTPLKLIDFGLSRHVSDTASTAVGACVTPKIGTAEYMAPEVFVGRASPMLADRMDIYSLGVILHVIFSGHFPSPHLAELNIEEYLAQPRWQSISRSGREFLGALLVQDPLRRPSVDDALRHPWVVSVAIANAEGARRLARGLPAAVRAHARSSLLRRIALVAVARELDECPLGSLRDVFSALRAACACGGLTRESLARIAATQPPPLATLAAELERRFATVDVDGSGVVEWSELVAVAMGGAGDALLRGLVPAPSDAVCLRAFDLLGGGSLAISAGSLCRLLGEVGDAGACGPLGSPTLWRPSPGVDDFERALSEVDEDGAICASDFLAMLRD